MGVTFYTSQSQQNVTENADQAELQADDGNESENESKSDDQLQPEHNTPPTSPETTSTKKPAKQSFRPMWVKAHPWLEVRKAGHDL